MTIGSPLSDRITVWGKEHCDPCKLAMQRIKSSGFEAEWADIDTVSEAPNLIRVEVMAALQMQGHTPVIQINDRAHTIKEAYAVLGITKGRKDDE
jgi:glutaredoxin